MPDYKAMYFELFRASVQAAQLLQDAQKRAEQHLLEADPPPSDATSRRMKNSFSSVSVLALSVTFGASSPKGET